MSYYGFLLIQQNIDIILCNQNAVFQNGAEIYALMFVCAFFVLSFVCVFFSFSYIVLKKLN